IHWGILGGRTVQWDRVGSSFTDVRISGWGGRKPCVSMKRIGFPEPTPKLGQLLGRNASEPWALWPVFVALTMEMDLKAPPAFTELFRPLFCLVIWIDDEERPRAVGFGSHC
ncbi:hypothetical protein SAMN06265373_1061, partial [Shimia sagamensis]